MCAISGLFNGGTPQILTEMSDRMSHRGPDDSGMFWFNDLNSGLAHRRLSIIDLTIDGHQPMFSHDSRYSIVFNGEIYNYLELRNTLEGLGYRFKSKSDTEVLLYLFVEYGQNSVELLNGIFSFAILDTKEKQLFCARDRMGVKPFYYCHSNNIFIFASEIKAIIQSGLIPVEIDFNSIYSPVHYQMAPLTGFKGINKLPAGNCLTYDFQKIEIKKYWQIFPTEDMSITYNEAFDKLEYLLRDSIGLQMMSDVPIGVLLSGGLDSSIIAALMRNKEKGAINSYTIKFNKSDLKQQGNVDDSVYARRVAEIFNLNHREIIIQPDIVDILPKIIWHLDEPLADPSAVNTYLISQAAKDDGISVLLNGIGGDEVFGGYRSYLACIYADYYGHLPFIAKNLLGSVIKRIPQASKSRNYKYIRWLKEFLNFSHLPRDERFLSSGNVSLTEENFNKYFLNSKMNLSNSYYFMLQKNLFSKDSLSYLTKMCLYDTQAYMTDHNLLYSDKASMAASVEGRPPLIDHRIVEFMFTLPPKFRINGFTQKYLLKKVAEKYLPKQIVYRPKAPFSAPMRGWLKNELREMVGDLLSESSLKNRGVYNPNYVQELIKNNQSGLQDNSQLIFRLLTNEIWFRTFFDEKVL